MYIGRKKKHVKMYRKTNILKVHTERVFSPIEYITTDRYK